MAPGYPGDNSGKGNPDLPGGLGSGDGLSVEAWVVVVLLHSGVAWLPQGWPGVAI